MKGLKLAAVAVGVAVDILGSLVIGLVAFVATADGQSLTEPVDMLDRFGTFGLVLMLAVGTAQTGLGGFVAGRIAKVNYVRHGLAVGVCTLVFGMLSALGPDSGLPMWYVVSGFVATLPVSALGGYLASGLPARTGRP
jgi:hypothetical protein